jgi:cyanophycinase-like exopeptidase
VVDGALVTWEPREDPNAARLTGYGPGGIGFFPHGLLDTHFANRGRHGRLLQLLADTAGLTRGDTRAFGVDENTALVVTGAPVRLGSCVLLWSNTG